MFQQWTSKRYFHGEIKGNRQSCEKCSDFSSGIQSKLSSPDGEVSTRLYVDEKTARTMMEIIIWDNKRKKYKELYIGTISGSNFRKVGV